VLALSFCLVYDLDIKSPFFLGTYLPVALIIGALCAATAPAATMAIVHEYKSKGPLTSILIGVVALDDSAAIIFFAFAVTLAKSFASHAAINWENFLLIPFFSIFVSLLIGGISGALLWKLSDFISRKGALFSIIIGSIFVTAGAASSLGVSPLLSSMMFGFMVVNLVQCHENLFNVVENIEEPIFGMFFMLAGAHMNFGVMRTAGWLALIITVGRFAGKLIGSRLGASASHASASVKKYLGFALLPSAGVAVGLVLEAREILGPSSYVSEVMVNAVLGSIIINELLTPFFVRSVLVKAGEAMRESDQGADKGVIE
jgi:Kef-type K+ transport system membrane component KefB